MLAAIIRLYANTHAPAYHVVVGDVLGSKNVAKVIRKLGPGVATPPAIGSKADADDHWVPRLMPLPFWFEPVRRIFYFRTLERPPLVHGTD